MSHQFVHVYAFSLAHPESPTLAACQPLGINPPPILSLYISSWVFACHCTRLVASHSCNSVRQHVTLSPHHVFRFDYANKVALDLMEATWEEFIGRPCSAATEEGQASSTLHCACCVLSRGGAGKLHAFLLKLHVACG